jgi:hypothetical protein
MPLRVAMVVPAEPSAIEALLEGLVGLNYAWMFRRGGAPPLYSSGIVYRREPPGHDDWQNAEQLLGAGFGDCEDLASYRAAELRMQGEPARVKVVTTRRGKFHAIVEHASGELEDPSLNLLKLERLHRHAHRAA